jgi:hypothetical protein
MEVELSLNYIIILRKFLLKRGKTKFFISERASFRLSCPGKPFCPLFYNSAKDNFAWAYIFNSPLIFQNYN